MEKNLKTQTESPVVSVVMPAYNAGRFIGLAVDSVLHQTFSDLELIIIDDFSTDDTWQLICDYSKSDSRIRVVKNEKNIGCAASKNRGLDLCRGQYVAFLDSDDVWYTEKLERQLQLIKASGADVAYTSYALVDSSGKKKCNDFIVPEKVKYEQLLRNNVIGSSTVMVTGNIAEKYRFNPGFYHEDYVLWLELLRSGFKAVGIPEVLVDYRVMENTRAGNKKNSAKYRYDIYRKYLNLSIFRSIILMIQYGISGIMKYYRRLS